MGTSRIIRTADYIIENRCTIREAAIAMGYSKSSVHIDMTENLRYVDQDKYCSVRMILDHNKALAARRGGKARHRGYKHE